MRLTTETSKLTGTPGISGRACVFEFTPPDPDQQKLRGRLVAVMSSRNEDTDNPLVERELAKRFEEEYFGKRDGSIFNSLKVVVENLQRGRLGIEIVAVIFAGDIVYAAVGGRGKVMLQRNGTLAAILEGKEKEVVCASGYPQKGDLLLLGTSSFFPLVSPEKIRTALASGREAGIESFALDIRDDHGLGDVGLAIVSFVETGAFENILPGRLEQKRMILPPLPRLKAPTFLGKLIQKFPERRIYVRAQEAGGGETAGARKRTLTVGTILLVLLLVSIGFGTKAKRDRDSRSRYSTQLTEASHRLAEAEGLYSLNPDRARELFAQSRETVNTLLAQKISDPELSALSAKLAEDEGKILGEYKEEPQSFIDLSLLSSGFAGNKIFSSSDKIFVLDNNGKKIVSVAYDTKRSEVVAGPDYLGNVSDATAYQTRVFALTDTGIYEVTDGKKKIADKDWAGDARIYAYTGNLYMLDKGANMVWRYQGTGDGSTFGAKQKWLGPGVSPDFSQVSSWAIDGSVWTLDPGGDISRFTMGKQDAFSLSGVAPALTSAQVIYSDGDIKSLYILDTANGRVLVISKEGKFEAQYLSDKIKEAKGVVVSEEQKKIILLLGNKLYSMELKHL